MSTAQYTDPAAEHLGQRPLTSYMRSVPGLRGVIVNPCRPGGGTPVNYDPHDRTAHEIHVVGPDGSDTKLPLSAFTKTAVTAALDAAAKRVPGNDINAIRERTAMTFEILAKMGAAGVSAPPSKKAAALPSLASQLPSATMDAEQEIEMQLTELEHTARTLSVPTEKIDRGYSPMAAFGLKKTPLPTISGPRPSAPATSGPPQRLVYFEKEGIGTVPAFFHDVLVHCSRPDPQVPEETGFIVLVYDTRFEQSAARWFPPADDPYQRPWAIKVADDNRLYLVQTTGFQYVYDSREYCVLTVERALWAPAGDE